MNPLLSMPTRCWSQIGIWGDHSCAELESWTHCHNCPVFRRAGRSLFDKAPPEDYVTQWTRFIAEDRAEKDPAQTSALIFRLADEWLAFSTEIFREVAESRPVHRLPHRSNDALLGLVNIRGGLQLCVSLRDLLGIAQDPATPPAGDPASRPETPIPSIGHRQFNLSRLIVVEKSGVCWAFPVDEIRGVHRFGAGDLQNVPVTVLKSAAAFTRGILRLDGLNVGCLDDELVFYHLKRSLEPAHE